MLMQIGKSQPDAQASVTVNTDGGIFGWHGLLFRLELSPCLLPTHKCSSCPVSAYVTVATEYRDEACLIAALEEMGYPVEKHAEAQALYGYQGDIRAEKANLIIRRKHVGRASNDIGFAKQADGSYKALISQYDQGVFTAAKQNQLKQKYAVAKVIKASKSKGYAVASTTNQDGTVKLVLKRY